MRDVLRLRDVRLFLGALAVPQAGDWLFGAALTVYMLQATGSATWVAAVGVVRLVPWIVLSPAAGVIADRVSRRRVLIASTLGQAVGMGVMTAVVLAGGDPAITLAIAAAAAAASVASSPAVGAALPMLGDERDLAAMNSWRSAILSGAMIVGPVLGAVLLLLGSPAAAFGANGLSLLVSAGMVVKVRTPLGPLGEERAPDANRPSALGFARAAASDLVTGARALVSSAAAALLLASAMAVLFAYTAQVVLWTVLADDHFGAGGDTLTLLFAAYGAGGVLATVPAARAAASPRAGRILAGSLVVGALSVVALARVTDLLPAALLIGAQGVVVTIADVLGITLLQRSLGAAVLGRALGAHDAMTAVAMVAGSAVAPVLLGLGGLAGGFVVTGGLLALVGIGALLALRKPVGLPADVASRLRHLVDLQLFAGAPRYALEGLASASREARVPAGTVLIREGDAPDDLFVLVEGAASVTAGASATPVNTLGPGDFFGEIGLVRRSPRTATVTTTVPSRLLRIDGELFLELVGSGAAHGPTLGRSVGQRLAKTRDAGAS